MATTVEKQESRYNGVPFLDEMDDDELLQFVNYIGYDARPDIAANDICGTRTGATKTTVKLRNFAWNTITARRYRRNGDIVSARWHERMADDIYYSLPEWAKW